MSGDVPNFSFTIEGVDQAQPPYYLEAVKEATSRHMRFYMDSPFFRPMARIMTSCTKVLLEADAVAYHFAFESRKVYAASCADGHYLERSTIFGPMPTIAGSLDIPRPQPGSSTWMTRPFRQTYELMMAVHDLQQTEKFCAKESWDRIHGLLQQMLTPERIETGVKLIAAAAQFEETHKPVVVDGFLQLTDDGNSAVHHLEGTFAHVWRNAKEARRFVAASQRVWQVILEHRLRGLYCPVTVMMQSRGRCVTFTPLVPIYGDVVDEDGGALDMHRLITAIVGNTSPAGGASPPGSPKEGDLLDDDDPDRGEVPLNAPPHAPCTYAGADAHYYITRPTAFGIIIEHLRGGKSIAIPFAPLRTESYVRLFPDGLSNEKTWTANSGVERVMQNAFEPVVKTLVKRARTKVTDLVQRGFVTALFRQYGLNIRFCYLVMREALKTVAPRTPEEMAITDALEAEMLCRALKTAYRADVSSFRGVLKDKDYLEKANRLLYYVNSGSRPIWGQLAQIIRSKFIGCPPSYVISPSPKLARIMTWFMSPKMGFNFDAEQGMFDKVFSALPVWYGFFTQPETVRLSMAGKAEATATAIGQHWQWIEGTVRPPVHRYQQAIEVTKWKQLNSKLAPEDPETVEMTAEGMRLDTTFLHQLQKAQVYEMLSHCVKVLTATHACGLQAEVFQLRVVKALDLALRYRNPHSPAYVHLCSQLVELLSIHAGEAIITHPIVDVFDEVCRASYFFYCKEMKSMAYNVAKLHEMHEGMCRGSVHFVATALQTVGNALVKATQQKDWLSLSTVVFNTTGVMSDVPPPLVEFDPDMAMQIRLRMRNHRGAQYLHTAMGLRLHYHIRRLYTISNRALSRPFARESAPVYVDFRVNPGLFNELILLSRGDLTLHIAVVGLLTHQSHIAGCHRELEERQRIEFKQLTKTYYAVPHDQRRVVHDDLYVGLSVAAFQYTTCIAHNFPNEELYSDAEVVTCFTRVIAAALAAVENVDNKAIVPILECHQAVNRVYPTKRKQTGLFFDKNDFDMIKSSIQSPMFAANLAVAMDDVLLVRRMWVVLNIIRQMYYGGSIMYEDDEDLDESVEVVDWCNRMADNQRAYAYRRLHGRFPDDTKQREQEIVTIKRRLSEHADLYLTGIEHMQLLQRGHIERGMMEHHEFVTRTFLEREADEWFVWFSDYVANYCASVATRTMQMAEILRRKDLEMEEVQAMADIIRLRDQNACEVLWSALAAESRTTAAVIYCDTYQEPVARHAIQGEQLGAIAKMITTTYYLYAHLPATFRDGYMRACLRSYEESVVFAQVALIQSQEASAWHHVMNRWNDGYYADALDRLERREEEMRSRLVQQEWYNFNVSVFTPIEAGFRRLIETEEIFDFSSAIADPAERMLRVEGPEHDLRAQLCVEEFDACASLLEEYERIGRLSIQLTEVSQTASVIVPEAQTLFFRTSHWFYFEGLLAIANQYAAGSASQIERDICVFDHEVFLREKICMLESDARRDLVFTMAQARFMDTIATEEEQDFSSIYERYQLESGQFKAADFEEYETVMRIELCNILAIQCISSIIEWKCEDVGAALLKRHTKTLLAGVVERETLARTELEASKLVSDRELVYNSMVEFSEGLSAREQWERDRMNAVHAVIFTEYTTRAQIANAADHTHWTLDTASEILAEQITSQSAADALQPTQLHGSLEGISGRHWDRVVAEQKHADALAMEPLPYVAAFGGPMPALLAQRAALRRMRTVHMDRAIQPVLVQVEEAVRRNEVTEWFGHFIATARAEFENIAILLFEHQNLFGCSVLVSVLTSASLNVSPLLLCEGHVVARVTAHSRREHIISAHAMNGFATMEGTDHGAIMRQHVAMVTELRKPPHRRSRSVLPPPLKTPSTLPLLEVHLQPLLPDVVEFAIRELMAEFFGIFKLLLFEDTLPVERTLRLRLQLLEQRAAMGIYATMATEAAWLAGAHGRERDAYDLPPLPNVNRVPRWLQVQTLAISQMRFYHTNADSDKDIHEGASIRGGQPSSQALPGRGIRASDRDDEEAQLPLPSDEPFDVTKMPRFRVFSDVGFAFASLGRQKSMRRRSSVMPPMEIRKGLVPLQKVLEPLAADSRLSSLNAPKTMRRSHTSPERSAKSAPPKLLAPLTNVPNISRADTFDAENAAVNAVFRKRTTKPKKLPSL